MDEVNDFEVCFKLDSFFYKASYNNDQSLSFHVGSDSEPITPIHKIPADALKVALHCLESWEYITKRNE